MPRREAASSAFQQALREDDAYALYEQAPCGYLSTSPAGIITKANATFLTWTGYAPPDVIGRRLTELLDAGGRLYHDTHYGPLLLMGGEAREIAFNVVRADGSIAPMLVNAVLDRDDAGQPRAIRIALFDATERRSYERELLEAKRRAVEAEARAVALARTLQETLIPPVPPSIPELDIAAIYRPAGRGDEVGGDFYDVFQAGEDWLIVLGDVSGKGAAAAVVTALVRHTVRTLALQTQSPSEILVTLNSVLLAHETERFCTVVLLRLHRENHEWMLSSSAGGHPLPILLRGGRLDDVGVPGCLVGVIEDPPFVDTTLVLQSDDMVVLHTDGVTEGRRGEEFYGPERMHTVLLKEWSDPGKLAQAIVDDVVGFQAALPRDDIAVLVLRVP